MSALGQKQTFLDVRFFLNYVRFTLESRHRKRFSAALVIHVSKVTQPAIRQHVS
jgi:hypothetical protein